ncbi:lipoprotein [Micromonospora sonchi]|uniref:Lipoprotein n=1 Tax=Micromonospora sonchi TaxID=1763543 RepID=A0A917X411_9ACTN|nr:lipoprotein [Micromonospora sonchi]
MLLAGCGSSSGGDDSAATAAGAAAGPANEGGNAAPAEKAGSAAATDTRVDQRSIIYTGSLQVKVDDVAAAAREAAATTTRAGGFVGGDQRRSSDADAVAELQLRVPADRFYAVVEELAALGVQQRREINTQDVTEETIDLDARITSQRARVESARRLLDRATSISDLVTLENELGRREADLASLEAKKRRLADLSALSTITVTLAGPDVSTAEEENEIGFLVGLRGGWKVFLTSMTVLLTVLGAILPWLLVLGVPLGALWWLSRRRRRNRTPEPPLVAPVGTPPPPGVSAPPPVPGARSAP